MPQYQSFYSPEMMEQNLSIGYAFNHVWAVDSKKLMTRFASEDLRSKVEDRKCFKPVKAYQLKLEEKKPLKNK